MRQEYTDMLEASQAVPAPQTPPDAERHHAQALPATEPPSLTCGSLGDHFVPEGYVPNDYAKPVYIDVRVNQTAGSIGREGIYQMASGEEVDDELVDSEGFSVQTNEDATSDEESDEVPVEGYQQRPHLDPRAAEGREAQVKGRVAPKDRLIDVNCLLATLRRTAPVNDKPDRTKNVRGLGSVTTAGELMIASCFFHLMCLVGPRDIGAIASASGVVSAAARHFWSTATPLKECHFDPINPMTCRR